jgi:hypothetical protein
MKIKSHGFHHCVARARVIGEMFSIALLQQPAEYNMIGQWAKEEGGVIPNWA